MDIKSNTIYWADLIADRIADLSNRTDKRVKFHLAGITALKKLQDHFAQSQRAIASNSQSELQDGFILNLISNLENRPFQALQAIHSLKSIWSQLYAQQLVEDLEFSHQLEFLHKLLYERTVFVDWLSSWPTNLNNDLQILVNTLLAHSVCIQDCCPLKSDTDRFWTLFTDQQYEMSEKYFRRGLPDLRKYTLQMSKGRFLKTAPIAFNTKAVHWTQTDRAKKIDLKRKSAQRLN